MTREEVIKVLLQHSEHWKRLLTENICSKEEGSQTVEALNMAIQALTQVSEIEENIIKYMKKYPNHVGNTDFWEGFYACRNVVLQLENEYLPKEQEPCGDSISRQNIIDTYKSCADMLSDEELEGANLVMEWVYKEPSVNSQEQTGHWTKDKEPWGGSQGWKCDKCNHIYDINVVYSKMPYNFCPNCGAKMVEPQESEE